MQRILQFLGRPSRKDVLDLAKERARTKQEMANFLGNELDKLSRLLKDMMDEKADEKEIQKIYAEKIKLVTRCSKALKALAGPKKNQEYLENNSVSVPKKLFESEKELVGLEKNIVEIVRNLISQKQLKIEQEIQTDTGKLQIDYDSQIEALLVDLKEANEQYYSALSEYQTKLTEFAKKNLQDTKVQEYVNQQLTNLAGMDIPILVGDIEDGEKELLESQAQRIVKFVSELPEEYENLKNIAQDLFGVVNDAIKKDGALVLAPEVEDHLNLWREILNIQEKIDREAKDSDYSRALKTQMRTVFSRIISPRAAITPIEPVAPSSLSSSPSTTVPVENEDDHPLLAQPRVKIPNTIAGRFDVSKTKQKALKAKPPSAAEQFKNDAAVWSTYFETDYMNTISVERQAIAKRLFLSIDQGMPLFTDESKKGKESEARYSDLGTKNNEFDQSERFTPAALVSHGGFGVLVQVPPCKPGEDPNRLLNWIMTGDPNADASGKIAKSSKETSPVYIRTTATHSTVTGSDGEVYETKTIGIPLPGDKHFGMNIGLGDAKEAAPDDGRHGHIYMYWRAPTEKKPGALMFKLENSAPGKRNRFGDLHSFLAKISKFTSTLGQKIKDLKAKFNPNGVRIAFDESGLTDLIKKNAADFSISNLGQPILQKVANYTKEESERLEKATKDYDSANEAYNEDVKEFEQLDAVIQAVSTSATSGSFDADLKVIQVLQRKIDIITASSAPLYETMIKASQIKLSVEKDRCHRMSRSSISAEVQHFVEAERMEKERQLKEDIENAELVTRVLGEEKERYKKKVLEAFENADQKLRDAIQKQNSAFLKGDSLDELIEKHESQKNLLDAFREMINLLETIKTKKEYLSEDEQVVEILKYVDVDRQYALKREEDTLEYLNSKIQKESAAEKGRKLLKELEELDEQKNDVMKKSPHSMDHLDIELKMMLKTREFINVQLEFLKAREEIARANGTDINTSTEYNNEKGNLNRNITKLHKQGDDAGSIATGLLSAANKKREDALKAVTDAKIKLTDAKKGANSEETKEAEKELTEAKQKLVEANKERIQMHEKFLEFSESVLENNELSLNIEGNADKKEELLADLNDAKKQHVEAQQDLAQAKAQSEADVPTANNVDGLRKWIEKVKELKTHLQSRPRDHELVLQTLDELVNDQFIRENYSKNKLYQALNSVFDATVPASDKCELVLNEIKAYGESLRRIENDKYALESRIAEARALAFNMIVDSRTREDKKDKEKIKSTTATSNALLLDLEFIKQGVFKDKKTKSRPDLVEKALDILKGVEASEYKGSRVGVYSTDHTFAENIDEAREIMEAFGTAGAGFMTTPSDHTSEARDNADKKFRVAQTTLPSGTKFGSIQGVVDSAYRMEMHAEVDKASSLDIIRMAATYVERARAEVGDEQLFLIGTPDKLAAAIMAYCSIREYPKPVWDTLSGKDEDKQKAMIKQWGKKIETQIKQGNLRIAPEVYVGAMTAKDEKKMKELDASYEAFRNAKPR